ADYVEGRRRRREADGGVRAARAVVIDRYATLRAVQLEVGIEGGRAERDGDRLTRRNEDDVVVRIRCTCIAIGGGEILIGTCPLGYEHNLAIRYIRVV